MGSTDETTARQICPGDGGDQWHWPGDGTTVFGRGRNGGRDGARRARLSAYAASKAGLLSLARTLSGELLVRGIRVNGLSPGPTETPALGKLGLSDVQLAAMQAEIRDLVPIGRMGTAWELAKAAVFLASDESRFVVGTELLVDGGVANL